MKENEKVIIEEIKKLRQFGYSDEDIIKEFESKILKLNSLALSFFFAKNVKGADIQAHEKVIIASKDLERNYMFAKDVKGADVRAHGKVILESQDLNYNYQFAKDVLGADIKAHERVILDSGDLDYNYRFARDVDGADIELHENIIKKSGNIFYQKKIMDLKRRNSSYQIIVEDATSSEISQCKKRLNAFLDSILEQKKKVRVKK